MLINYRATTFSVQSWNFSVWKICVVMENVENEHNLYNVLILVS